MRNLLETWIPGITLLVFLVAVVYETGLWARLWAAAPLSTIAGALFTLALLIASILCARRVNWARESSEPRAFPAPSTVAAGLWLLMAMALCLGFLLWCLVPDALPPYWASSKEALVTMFAAGAGSLVTTTLGYLEHASYKADFKISFVPWYLFRPLIGMILGLVFYFVVRAGFWTLGAQPPALSPHALAATGALVGMFSKNASEKLKELFQGFFSTRETLVKDILERLPKDEREKLKKELKL